MKRLFFCFVLAFIATTIRAQDTLVMISGIRTVVSVLEIGPTTIRYKKATHLNGPDIVTSKKNIKKVILRDGTVENVTISAADQYQVTNPDMYKKGVTDANTHYKGPYGAVSTGITSFLVSAVGLIPAIIISATPPSDKNLAYPSAELWKDQSYQAGYRHRAKKIKQRNVGGALRLVFARGSLPSLRSIPPKSNS